MTAGTSAGGPSSTERASGAVVGGVVGAILASFASIIPAVAELGWWPVVIGGVGGLVYGALRPPRFTRVPFRLPEAVPGEPVPIGALGAATVRDLEGPTTTALVIGAVVGVGALPLAWWIYSALAVPPSMTVLGLIGVAGFVAALACTTFLPGLLLSARARTALVAHVWLAARDLRRSFGSPDAVRDIPVVPSEVPGWLASHPETDANREVIVEVHLLGSDWDAARRAIDRMPRAAPRERFVATILRAMLDYQRGAPVDDRAVRDAVEAVPDGVEAVEAAVAVAAFDARRALPDGDWREPLVRARRLIPEGDLPILLRDFGAVNFRTVLRRVWPMLAFLVVLALVLGLTVDGVAA
jgi:hypothetical protein